MRPESSCDNDTCDVITCKQLPPLPPPPPPLPQLGIMTNIPMNIPLDKIPLYIDKIGMLLKSGKSEEERKAINTSLEDLKSRSHTATPSQSPGYSKSTRRHSVPDERIREQIT